MSATITTADVMSDIKRQLDWRGPSGKGQGHVVLKREHAEFLYKRLVELVLTQDAHIARIEELEAGKQ